MKLSKIFLLFSFLAASAVQANIAPLWSIIDTLKITDNKWSVNISRCEYQNGFYKNAVIDSIMFSNHTDSAKVKQTVINNIVKLNNNYQNYKFTVDSLEKAITIKQTGDLFFVVVYGHYDSGKWKHKDSLLFGDEIGACVRAPKDGEFLSSKAHRKSDCGVTVCNNQTCYATLKGRIFDKNGEPLCNKTFDTFSALWYFTTDSDGKYSLNINTGFSIAENELIQAEYSFLKDHSITGYHFYSIEPISYNASPGDTIVRDIYLKDAYVSEGEKKSVLSQFFCLPNPAREQIVFTYFIDNSIAMNDVALLVYDASGKLMDKLSIDTNEGSLIHNLDARYKAGSYSYVMRGKNTLIYQGQFFVQ